MPQTISAPDELRLATGSIARPYHYYGRNFRFETLPLGFFARIAVGLLSAMEIVFESERRRLYPYRLWCNGMAIWWWSDHSSRGDDAGGDMALLYYDASSFELQVVVLMVREQALKPSSGARLVAIVDVIESVISGFYSTYANGITRFVVCSHCLERSCIGVSPASISTRSLFRSSFSSSMTLFAIVDCLEALQSNKSLICSRTPATAATLVITLEDVAPDLALSDAVVFRESDVSIVQELGKGSYGQVWLGTMEPSSSSSLILDPLRARNRQGIWQQQQQQLLFVAVKALHHNLDTEASSPREEALRFLAIHREIAMMSRFRHPNLLQLHGIMLRPLRMVLEYAPLGDLYKVLHDPDSVPDDRFTWKLRTRIALDVALGIEYLHSLSPPVIHRDLRSPNVFLMRLHESAPGVLAKVADFGLAQSLVISSGITDRLETWQWMAPEAFGMNESLTYTERADVYSFGIILWELATRKHPFDEIMHNQQKISVYKLKDSISRGNKHHYHDINNNSITTYLLNFFFFIFLLLQKRILFDRPLRKPQIGHHHLVR